MIFSDFFHESSKDLSSGGESRVPRDSNLWPAEWKTIHYKTYPRSVHIPFENISVQADLFDTIAHRISDRGFRGTSLSLGALGALLGYSCGIFDVNGKMTRAQPSAGGRYPIEAYPIVFHGNEELRAGVYHYNIKEHALETLWQRAFSPNQITELCSYEWAAKASALIVLTGVFSRSKIKYGERGYRYALLEAGHIGQNIYLTSEALGLRVCALGGTRDDRLEKLLDIDGITESVVYGILIGA